MEVEDYSAKSECYEAFERQRETSTNAGNQGDDDRDDDEPKPIDNGRYADESKPIDNGKG